MMGMTEGNGVGDGMLLPKFTVDVTDPTKGLARLSMKDDMPAMHPNPPLPTDSFRDITAEFFEASAKLNVGQLVKDPYFTLLQAVGALEIMDPKMDSGMLEAEYESFDALQPRLPEEIIGIMDQLLSYEMAWHNGSALSQTLFTCLYIDRLLSPSQKTMAEVTFASPTGASASTCSEEQQLLENVLKPYCLALIKCCCYVNQQIQMEHIYEEEDFVTQTYNVSLFDSVTQNEVLNSLESGLEWLEGSKGLYTGEIFEALRCRLSHRKALFRDLSHEIEEWVAGAPPEWDSSLELLMRVEKTHKLGKAVPEAFSTSVQRKLASQVPPRPIVEISFEDATSSLKKLCAEGKDVLRVLNYQGSTNLVNYFLNFMTRRPSPSPYIRSLLQSLFFKDMKILGTMSVKQVLFDDVRELCNPVELLLDPRNEAVEAPQDPRFKIVERTNWFIERAGRAYLDLFRNICQNRSRLRRNLCHAILDWDSLQVESEEIDSELRELTKEEPQTTANGPSYSFPLSSWVYLYKLRQMEWIILLGFELEVYQPHEFAGMYWYLQHYVRTKIGHIERIRQFAALIPKGNSKQKKKKGPTIVGQQQKSLSLLTYYLLEASAMQELAGAMINVYVSLMRLTLLRKPPQPYSSDVLRYDLRMKPFLTIGCPEVVPFDIFESLVDNPEIETLELLELASESVTQARKDLDQLSKLDANTARAVLCEASYKINNREMLRSCVGLGVAIAQITKALKSAGGATKENLEIEIDRVKYHPSFPVPSIRNKKTLNKK